jgi:hypothetical protein
MSEKFVKFVPRDRISITRARVPENEIESQDTSCNAEGEKVFDIPIVDIIVHMVVVSR